jgi:hypothetical protein|tara:strand:+ start:285 stop:1205 length:921 start_codon:yes stop_codon:yes gene_type:complete
MLDLNNFLLRGFYKLFNRSKYKNYKNLLQIKNDQKLFKVKFEKYINQIQDNLNNKKEISFLHSGHTGDIINILPILKNLSKTHKCKLYIQLDSPISKFYPHHPAGQVFMNKKIYDMLLPLLKKQQYLDSIETYNKQNIDINFDIIRELPIRLTFDSMKYGFHISGIQADLNETFLSVDEHLTIKNKIIILRSLRYQNHFINYDFLSKYEDVYFIGTINEYDDLKKNINNLRFYNCKDFLDMAQIIKSCKLFIGNSSMGFTIAEGLKVPRLLEAYPWNGSQQVHGFNGYDFYFQSHFEKFFQILHNK